MLRADNVICGTSTTGTGTLTLAATPTPPGGVDFDVWARATGIGFINSAAIQVSYTIIEYTDSTFATAMATEKGIGTLTLGGSSGIANATLARTTKHTSATSLNSQPATQNIVPATGISIATAANTLVFIGASASDLLAANPYFNLINDDNIGVAPPGTNQITSGTALTTGWEFFIPFLWITPMLVKKISTRVTVNYTGGTSNVYGRLYDVGTDGRAGKLLIDLGVMGTGGSSLASTGYISSAVATNGFFLLPGYYFCSIYQAFSGGSGSPALAYSNPTTSFDGSQNFAGGQPNGWFVSTTLGNATAPDAANTAGGYVSQQNHTSPYFWLKNS